MKDDAELLRCFARDRDEAAFAEVVRRQVDLVHSAASRQVNGDVHLARDVTQMVFADLARKADVVAGERVLAAWLFVSTRYAAAKLVRGEQRRRVREQEAQIMEELMKDDATTVEWERVRPVLDEAMGELKGVEREAILLRFFEGRGFAEVGARLSLNENAARMRVERALDKLHRLLARRGVTSTTGALAVALANQAVGAAPAGLAASVAGAAMAGAGVAAAGIGFMTIGKLSVGVAAGLLVGGAGSLWWQQAETAKLEREWEQARRTVASIAVAREEISLERPPAESAETQRQDAELNRLAVEAEALRMKLQMGRGAIARPLSGAAVAKADGAASQSADELDRLPRATYRRPPTYPVDMRQSGTEGEAVIRFVVGVDGRVARAEVVRSTHPSFEAPALEAVKTWQFDAGRKGGVAVNTQLEMPIRFSLAKDDSSAAPIESWF